MRRLAIPVVVALLGLTACAQSAYDTTGDAFRPTRPALLGIQIKHDTVNAIGSKCYMGLAVNGAAAVGTALMPPAGIAAWIIYGSLTGGTGLTLAECWDEYNTNRDWFEVYTQCVGEPMLTTTITDFNEIGATVSIPSCRCRIICIYGSNVPTEPAGLFPAAFQWNMAKNYWHDGANRINGPTTGDPEPPPDYNAMAASMGLTYGGCMDMSGGNATCTPR